MQLHRDDIEGLRAVAVGAVLMYHFGVPGFAGGFIGVDVFFVISGYLITSLLIHEFQQTGRISIKAFYARRARRLLPISATVVVFTAVFGAIVLPATRLGDLAEDVGAAALFSVNLLLGDRSTDYVNAALPASALQHYWSLAVEEQFYLVWPALIALVTIGARSGRGRILATTSVIVAVSFTLSAVLTVDHPSWSYFGMHTRAWELAFGGLLAAAQPSIDRIHAALRATVGWLGVAAVAVSAVTFGDVLFPGWAAALPVLGAGAVLIAGQRAKWSPAVLLTYAPITYLGGRSYSLYLWHWPIIVLAEVRLERTLTWSDKAVAAALVFALAEVGYRTIEHPIRSSRSLATRPTASLLMGAALVATGVLAAVAVNAFHPNLGTGVVAAAPAAIPAPSAVPPASTDPPAVAGTTVPSAPAPIEMSDVATVQAVADALSTDVVPDNVRPPLLSAEDDTPIIYGNGCHQYLSETVKADCVFGDPGGAITIALWGDSHAAQWFTAFDTVARTHGWRLLSITQGGCPYLDVPVWNRAANADFPHCEPWRTAALDRMLAESVDVVFLSQHYGMRSASDRQFIRPDVWEVQLSAVVVAVRSVGIEPVIIADSPNPADDVPGCVAEHKNATSICNAHSDEPAAAAVDAVLRSVAASTGVGLVEPNRWVCSDGVCPVVVGDILVYRDGDHLSNTFVEWLTPAVDAVVGPYIGDFGRFRDSDRS